MAETAFKLRHPNIRTIQAAAPSGGWSAGDVVKKTAGGPWAVVVSGQKGEATIAENGIATLAIFCEAVVLPTYNGADGVFAIGGPVYWDATDGKCSNDADTGTNELIGFAREAVASATTTIELEFDGRLNVVEN